MIDKAYKYFIVDFVDSLWEVSRVDFRTLIIVMDKGLGLQNDKSLKYIMNKGIIAKSHLGFRKYVFFIFLILLTSCRVGDQDSSLVNLGKSVGFRINLLGSEYKNVPNDGAMNLKIQSKTMMLNPSNFIYADLSTGIETSLKDSNQALSPKSGVSSKSSDVLATGMKFRVLVYDASGHFITYTDYTVGLAGSSIMLNYGETYTIVVYSYNTSTLPALSDGERTSLSNAQVFYDASNPDFMHYTTSFTPLSNDTNYLDIVLYHKVTQVTTTISAGNPLGQIYNISDSFLSPHYTDGVYSLESGYLFDRTSLSSGVRLDFSGTSFPTTAAVSSPVFINYDSYGDLAGSFIGDITIGGVKKRIDLGSSFIITPGNRSSLKINLTSCGAYLGPNGTNWKEFMCHNLGSDVMSHAFIPSSSLHGARYQWGTQTPSSVQSSNITYVSQDDDQGQYNNSNAITGWNTVVAVNGSWSDTSKTVNDPCPSGYRVPTRSQWQQVLDNNVASRVGNWQSGNNPTNYSSGILLGGGLFLPATGVRNFSNGSLSNRGFYGYYWSSTSGSGSNASYFTFSYNASSITSYNRTEGLSVRCISVN